MLDKLIPSPNWGICILAIDAMNWGAGDLSRHPNV